MLDLPAVGAYKYARHPVTECLVWGYAFDAEAPKVWSPRWAWGNTSVSTPDPERPEELLDHVAEDGYVIAWNAFFDRLIWNYVMVPKYGWPHLEIDQVLCAQAQAEANNLPGNLAKAAETIKAPYRKDPKGKILIQKLSRGTRHNWQSDAYENVSNMGHMRSYCASDVVAMRGIWDRTRPLTDKEWHEYHVSERINERGVMVDYEFATAAKDYAEDEFTDLNGQLQELTGDSGITVNTHLRKAKWLFDELWPDEELQEVVRRPSKPGGKERFSCDRPTRDAVLEIIAQPEHSIRFDSAHADKVVRFLELIEAGNSAAVRKFTAIVNQQWNRRVYGSYAFNGGGQTGRFSSRGVQVHNIIRAPVDKDNPDRSIDAIEMIMAGRNVEWLRKEFGFPISRLLARLIRPTFVAPQGKTLVWADWDQIEGRVLPWLAKSPHGEAKLDMYRSNRDVYTDTAAEILNVRYEEVTDDERQVYGKVPELALGFGGSVGALSSMARNYGAVIPEEQKKPIVEAWRRENPWAPHFWGELWGAAMKAYSNPGLIFHAGRIQYVFSPNLMGGTLCCILPDDRILVYPQFRHERKDIEDDDGNIRSRWVTSYVKGFGSGAARVELWYGILAENATQAVAASILRHALTQLDPFDIVVLHTHDEIVAEVDEYLAEENAQRLRISMTYLPEWAKELPLTVSIDHGPYYVKT